MGRHASYVGLTPAPASHQHNNPKYMDTNKLENIISGYKINSDDAAWLRALTQQPGKVLTDDEAHKLAHSWWATHMHPRDAVERTDDLMRFAFQLRDNGYLAPAAGLTVEEVKRLLRDAVWRTGNGKALKDFYAKHGGL